MRVNVWLPDELNATIKQELPDVNVSAVLQDALRALLGCRHDRVSCAACAKPVDLRSLIDEALCSLYLDLHWKFVELIDRGGTVEGAARVAKEIATRHRVSCAPNIALARPSRAQRQRQRVLEFPDTPAAVAAVPNAKEEQSA